MKKTNKTILFVLIAIITISAGFVANEYISQRREYLTMVAFTHSPLDELNLSDEHISDRLRLTNVFRCRNYRDFFAANPDADSNTIFRGSMGDFSVFSTIDQVLTYSRVDTVIRGRLIDIKVENLNMLPPDFIDTFNDPPSHTHYWVHTIFTFEVIDAYMGVYESGSLIEVALPVGISDSGKTIYSNSEGYIPFGFSNEYVLFLLTAWDFFPAIPLNPLQGTFVFNPMARSFNEDLVNLNQRFALPLTYLDLIQLAENR